MEIRDVLSWAGIAGALFVALKWILGVFFSRAMNKFDGFEKQSQQQDKMISELAIVTQSNTKILESHSVLLDRMGTVHQEVQKVLVKFENEFEHSKELHGKLEEEVNSISEKVGTHGQKLFHIEKKLEEK